MKRVLAPIAFFILLLAVILTLDVLSIRHTSITYDEWNYLEYGKQILNLDSDFLTTGKMPFSCLNAIPVKLGGELNAARIVTVLFSLLLAFYVFRWSKALYGQAGAFFSLILYAFCPNIIAHSRLVTTDLYAAAMATISTYYFWRFIKHGGWPRAAVSALTLALSQLAKHICIFLYPIFALVYFIRCMSPSRRPIRPGSVFKVILLFLVVSIVVINIGLLFNKTLIPFGQYKFKSHFFNMVQSRLSLLHNVPVPLPEPYLVGLDRLKLDDETGEMRGNIYLLGKLHEKDKGPTGFKGYYFYAFLFKVPIAIQLFILFSVIVYIINRKKYNFLENEIFLLCPVLFFTIYFNFFFNNQLGIRYLLVTFPFLYIFCGSLCKNWALFSLKLKSLFAVLILYLVVSNLSYFPHYISYFNELVWDRKKAYKILADSNIDWGQDGWYVEQYKKSHPDIHISPSEPVAGRVIVGVNQLVGVFNPQEYKWLRENFEPVDHIAYSTLVYDVPAEALEKIRKSR